MNPRPILIATCCALALVAFVYFLGKQHFSPSVDDTVDRTTPQPEPVTVYKSPTPSESLEPEASEISISTERKDADLQRDMESTTDEAGRYTSGPYKGMTFEQAQRYSEWVTHRRELQGRLIEQSKKERAHAREMIQSAEDELSVMRSAFNLMSPEQLQILRREALKVGPRDKVENFFEALANDETTRTPTQILEDAQKIVDTNEMLNLVFDQLNVESEQLKEAFRASDREFDEIMKGDNE